MKPTQAQKELTHAQCKVLAGSPLLLAASDEQAIRQEWERMERVYKAAMKWYRTFGEFPFAGRVCKDLAKACAAARKK
jgi:hypothetical protein